MPPKPRQLVWPIAGLVAGTMMACNRLYVPRFTVGFGIAAFCAATLLVLILAANPIGARLACLVSGLNLAVPCFVYSTPLDRGLLMCLAAAPFMASASLVFAPAEARRDLRGRVKHVFSWGGTRQTCRCPRKMDFALLLRLLLATAVFGGAVAAIKSIPANGFWLPARWLAGIVLILAFAEMTTACIPFVGSAFGVSLPPLMRSPHLSISITEFWTKRWNIFASQKIFRPFCFTPLAKHGVASALWMTFFVSAIAHVLLLNMATGKWKIAFLQGAFFLAQPPLILIERKLGVRRWPKMMARTWTLAALAMVSPLFVEPSLQFLEASWRGSGFFIGPTVWVFGFVVVLSGIVSLASLAGQPKPAEIAFPVSNSLPMR